MLATRCACRRVSTGLWLLRLAVKMSVLFGLSGYQNTRLHIKATHVIVLIKDLDIFTFVDAVITANTFHSKHIYIFSIFTANGQSFSRFTETTSPIGILL